MNSSVLTRSAAEIAAVAFYETFPGVELLGGKQTSLGFSFDFHCSLPLPPQAEVLIEEKMRQIIREKRSISVMEMVPFSARELLLKEGHQALAEQTGEEGLVEIVRIGNFYSLSEGPHLSCTSQLTAFKLWPIQTIEPGLLRLSGCASSSKEELKQFLKRLRDYPERSHEKAGIEKSLWHLLRGQVVWLPEGLRMQKELIEIIREQLFQNLLEVRLTADESRASAHALLAKERKEEGIGEIYTEPGLPWDPEMGLFVGVGGGQIRVSLYPSPANWREKVISSLQLTGKTLNILGFQHRLCYGGRKRSGKEVQALLQTLNGQGIKVEMQPEKSEIPRLDLMVDDQLGRQWPAISIELAANAVYITASVERLVALLIEMKSCINDGERH